jgi:hypothetical protein
VTAVTSVRDRRHSRAWHDSPILSRG